MTKPKILLAEDSRSVAQIIEDLLEKHKYHFMGTVDSAEESIKATISKMPDVVIMDIGLSGNMTGLEAAEIITRDHDIPVIFLTSETDVGILDNALKSMCSTYLTKPVQEADLIINIEIVLQRNRLRQTAEKERRWREVILDGIIDAVVAVDESGHIVYMNTPATVLLESTGTFAGKTLDSFVEFLDMNGHAMEGPNEMNQHTECRMRTRTGHSHVVLMKTQVLPDPNSDSIVKVITLDNITEEWLMQEKIRYMTFHDHLTGLYNRNFLDEELIRLNTERQLPISIIMADLNGLKITNDILGHVDGDLLLKACAHQLRESCRNEDIIARFGGDEFLVFLPQTSEADVIRIIQRIRAGCERTITPLGPMSVALGRYTKNTIQETMQSAIMRSDEDMYRDKDKLKKNYTQNCFNYVYGELQKHPYEGHQFTNHVVDLMGRLIEYHGDIHDHAIDIEHLGQIYDIGMICLPSHIFTYSRFKEGDWEMIQKHSEMSYKIVNLNPKYAPVAEAVLYHHERWDGKGYPYHLKKEAIPILARLLSVVDAYCSMIRPRHYREALTRQDALIEIAKGAGTQFDPSVVDLFISMMAKDME